MAMHGKIMTTAIMREISLTAKDMAGENMFGRMAASMMAIGKTIRGTDLGV